MQEHLAAGERDPLAEASRLLERWYLIGPMPADRQDELEPRFQRVLAALLPATAEGEDRVNRLGPGTMSDVPGGQPQ